MSSFRPLLRQRAIAPTTAGLIAASIALYPRTTLHAEAPEKPPGKPSESRSFPDAHPNQAPRYKKPIYADPEASAPRTLPSAHERIATTQPKTSPPTPTDRLARRIGQARIFLHARVAAAETKLNEAMDSAFALEHSFTATLASLAPAPATGEKLIPGALYVLVAAMAGSIVARRHNVLLRGAVPVAVGVGAAWLVLPVTMRNVSDLLWVYERRVPVIADGHVRTRESLRDAWRMARLHAEQVSRAVDEKVTEGREALEGWLRKGK